MTKLAAIRGIHMNENGICNIVTGCAIEVQKHLGPGLPKSVYLDALERELAQSDVTVKKNITVPVVYKGELVGEAFSLDLLVDSKIVVACKLDKRYDDLYDREMLAYLRLSGNKMGIIINFGETDINKGAKIIEVG